MNTENKVRWYHHLLSIFGFTFEAKKGKPVALDEDIVITIPVKEHYKCPGCNSQVTVIGEFMSIKSSKLTPDFFPINKEGVCRFCELAVDIEVTDGRYKPL